MYLVHLLCSIPFFLPAFQFIPFSFPALTIFGKSSSVFGRAEARGKCIEKCPPLLSIIPQTQGSKSRSELMGCGLEGVFSRGWLSCYYCRTDQTSSVLPTEGLNLPQSVYCVLGPQVVLGCQTMTAQERLMTDHVTSDS